MLMSSSDSEQCHHDIQMAHGVLRLSLKDNERGFFTVRTENGWE